MVLDDFPASHGPEREADILRCVKNGRAKYNFVKITSEHNGHTAEFQVFEDALKVDGIRVNVTAITQQRIADMLQCILPTAKLYDLMWHHCEKRIEPNVRSITSSTKAMIEHSQKIDSALEKIGHTQGIKATVGKTWIIDNGLKDRPEKACNYGWHFEKGNMFRGINGNPCASLLKNPSTGLYWHMIQSRGFYHDAHHVDYSQICVLVSRQCWVDGTEMDIHDVLRDPELSPLANHDGVLKLFRQPRVREAHSIVDLPVKTEPEPEPESVRISTVIPIVSVPSEQPTLRPPEVYSIEPVKKEESSGIWVLIMTVLQAILSLFGRK